MGTRVRWPTMCFQHTFISIYVPDDTPISHGGMGEFKCTTSSMENVATINTVESSSNATIIVSDSNNINNNNCVDGNNNSNKNNNNTLRSAHTHTNDPHAIDTLSQV